MPTEDEVAPLAAHTVPSLSHLLFSTCPPEETREAHAPRETRIDSPVPNSSLRLPEGVDAIRPGTDDGPDMRPGAAVETVPREETNVQGRNAKTVADSPSPVGSPEVSQDADMRLAQSLASTALGNTSDEAASYALYPSRTRLKPSPNSTSSYLHPGSKFEGKQKSDKQEYVVQVEIKDVDLSESTLCGYLRIQGLTDDHPTLTTFFEGEIIGPKYPFKTQHPSWNSSEKIDFQHWARFNAWRPLAQDAKASSTFTLQNYLEREDLFMRWKEYFLVPDHRVKSISGASFEGFYYICFNQRTGNVKGIYFHAKSEKYQQLELDHVPNNGCMSAMEFR